MASQGKLVMIVEDSPTQALAIRFILQKAGMRVVHAMSGHTAMHTLKQVIPDVIVMDINMPGMDGLETIRKLRDAPKTMNIPIIILTGQVDQDTVQKGSDLGVIQFIPKDKNFEQTLLEVIQTQV